MIADDIERMNKDYGVQSFFLMDTMLNYPPGRALELSSEIAKRKINISWSATFHPISIDREVIRNIRASGCNTMMLSPDVLSEKMMVNMRKGFNVDDVMNAASAMEAEGMRYIVSLLLGGPGESRKTIEETMQNLAKLKPVMATIRAGLRITPFTGLHKIAVEEGLIKETSSLLMPTFYLSREFKNVEDSLSIVRELRIGHPNWLISGVEI